MLVGTICLFPDLLAISFVRYALSQAIKFNTQREIPFLRAPMYYPLAVTVMFKHKVFYEAPFGGQMEVHIVTGCRLWLSTMAGPKTSSEWRRPRVLLQPPRGAPWISN